MDHPATARGIPRTLPLSLAEAIGKHISSTLENLGSSAAFWRTIRIL